MWMNQRRRHPRSFKPKARPALEPVTASHRHSDDHIRLNHGWTLHGGITLATQLDDRLGRGPRRMDPSPLYGQFNDHPTGHRRRPHRGGTDFDAGITRDGLPIHRLNTYIIYLGVYLTCAKKFQANFDHAKSNLYRAFNGIMAKVGRSASHDVMVQLLRSKCLPILLYGTEA